MNKILSFFTFNAVFSTVVLVLMLFAGTNGALYAYGESMLFLAVIYMGYKVGHYILYDKNIPGILIVMIMWFFVIVKAGTAGSNDNDFVNNIYGVVRTGSIVLSAYDLLYYFVIRKIIRFVLNKI